MKDTGRIHGLRQGIVTTVAVCCQHDNGT